MIRQFFQVLYLLLVVKHEPTLGAEHLSVRFSLDIFNLCDKIFPLLAILLNHFSNYKLKKAHDRLNIIPDRHKVDIRGYYRNTNSYQTPCLKVLSPDKTCIITNGIRWYRPQAHISRPITPKDLYQSFHSYNWEEVIDSYISNHHLLTIIFSK